MQQCFDWQVVALPALQDLLVHQDLLALQGFLVLLV
jgi:hypothetical protein